MRMYKKVSAKIVRTARTLMLAGIAGAMLTCPSAAVRYHDYLGFGNVVPEHAERAVAVVRAYRSGVIQRFEEFRRIHAQRFLEENMGETWTFWSQETLDKALFDFLQDMGLGGPYAFYENAFISKALWHVSQGRAPEEASKKGDLADRVRLELCKMACGLLLNNSPLWSDMLAQFPPAFEDRCVTFFADAAAAANLEIKILDKSATSDVLRGLRQNTEELSPELCELKEKHEARVENFFYSLQEILREQFFKNMTVTDKYVISSSCFDPRQIATFFFINNLPETDMYSIPTQPPLVFQLILSPQLEAMRLNKRNVRTSLRERVVGAQPL